MIAGCLSSCASGAGTAVAILSKMRSETLVGSEWAQVRTRARRRGCTLAVLEQRKLTPRDEATWVHACVCAGLRRGAAEPLGLRPDNPAPQVLHDDDVGRVGDAVDG